MLATQNLPLLAQADEAWLEGGFLSSRLCLLTQKIEGERKQWSLWEMAWPALGQMLPPSLTLWQDLAHAVDVPPLPQCSVFLTIAAQ